VNTAAVTRSAREVAAAVRQGVPASPQLVNRYYALCIPFYREFLGDHWHTGFYAREGAIGPPDQLRMEAVVAESAALAAGTRVLDVGCGVGGPACHLARSTGAHLRGLTPNEAQLDIARASAARQGLKGRVRFDLGEASELPYPDASFDAVLFFESPCHFPDRPRFFAEAWRVLRRGGRLAGEDWLLAEQAPEPARSQWGGRIAATWAIPGLGTVASYAQQMAHAGFRVDLARDMREEMALLRGFVTQPADRDAIRAEMDHTADPIRKLVMEGVLVLGEAAERGAFTVGRFLAVKPAEH
jgi:cyclopropane fatty-acyl-phospholipid synthase-like methyltransferase